MDQEGKPLTKVTRTKGSPKAATGQTPAAAAAVPAAGAATTQLQTARAAEATAVDASAEAAAAPAADATAAVAAAAAVAAPAALRTAAVAESGVPANAATGTKKLNVHIIFYSTLGRSRAPRNCQARPVRQRCCRCHLRRKGTLRPCEAVQPMCYRGCAVCNYCSAHPGMPSGSPRRVTLLSGRR